MKSIWLQKRFLILTSGNMFNNAGNIIYDITIPFLVYKMTQSALAMSSMILFSAIAILLLHPFIGMIVDRCSRRTLLFGGLVLQTTLLLVLILLHQHGGLQVWMIYLFVLADDIARTFIGVAQFAVLPALFDEQRQAASAANTTAFTISSIAAPLAGGLLFQTESYDMLLLLDAITCVLPIFCLIRVRLPHEKMPSVRSLKQVGTDLRESSIYLLRNQTLSSITATVALAEIVDANVFATILLYDFKHHLVLPDSLISWILAAKGVGFFLGSLLPMKLKKYPSQFVLLITMVISSFGIALMFTQLWMFATLALFLVSLGRMAAIVQQNIILQEVVPREQLGRVNSLVRMTRILPSVIMPALFGGIAQTKGGSWAFGVMFIFSLLPVGLILWKRSQKNSRDVEIFPR